MDSILTSVKKILGIAEEYTEFDADIIMSINSVFMILQQLGVGPEAGFSISDASATWSQYFADDDTVDAEAVKSYVEMMTNDEYAFELDCDEPDYSASVGNVVLKRAAVLLDENGEPTQSADLEEKSDEEKEAEIKDIPVEEILDSKILNIEPGSNGLVLQPYWGPGLKRPNAKGVIIGFSDYHTKMHVYRAIIEGICYALKEGLETIRKRNRLKSVDYIVVSGGGSKNEIICQIVANIFNLKVKRTETFESSSLGAAMAGFLSLGYFSSPEEAKESMVKYSQEFEPEEEAVKKYDYLYKKVYKKIYPKLNRTYSHLKEYTNSEIL